MAFRLIALAAVALTTVAMASSPATSPSPVVINTDSLSEAKIAELHQKLLDVGGCNANICFAIDGSSSMPPESFLNEKNFVLDTSSIIGVDEPVEMAAVQYATSTSRITPLTVDSEKFVHKVSAAKQRGGKTFVTGGINYCFSQLWRRPFEANTIVVLGDGNNNVGSSAIARANLFRKVGGIVTVVSAGKANEDKLLKIAGGSYDHVFEVTSFLDALVLQAIIEEFTKDICHH